MDVRHLRYFVAVAEELHFRRAAERLHVAQPAVSEQIRKLEDELGVQLLHRSQRGVALTDAGAVFLREARRVIAHMDLARSAARNARESTTVRLSVGYLQAALPASVPRALQRVAESTPQVETSLRPGTRDDLLDAVAAARLDAAVVPLPAATAGLRVTRLGAQRAVAALPASHRHATASALRLAQVAPERIVLLAREANPPFFDAVVAACHHARLAPTLIEMPKGQAEAALLTVVAGAGLALLPDSVAERYPVPGVRFVPLAGSPVAVEIAIVTPRATVHAPTASLLDALSREADATPPAAVAR
jgi:DNA-binding transcriptional LysR family regulator